MEDIVSNVDPAISLILLSIFVLGVAVMFILSMFYIRRAARNIKKTTQTLTNATSNLERAFTSMMETLKLIEDFRQAKQAKDNQKQITGK